MENRKKWDFVFWKYASENTAEKLKQKMALVHNVSSVSSQLSFSIKRPVCGPFVTGPIPDTKLQHNFQSVWIEMVQLYESPDWIQNCAGMIKLMKNNF